MKNPDKTTLIVGASSSFGQVIASLLAKEKHALFLTYWSQKAYTAPSEARATVLPLDVIDVQAIDSTISQCEKVNNLVYSVGSLITFQKWMEEEWEQYEMHWRTQVRGLWHVVQALTRNNHPLNNIVVIGSAVTFNQPPARLNAYTTAKYGLLGLVKALSVELASKNIRVNMVAPRATGRGLSRDWNRLLLTAGGTADINKVAHLVVSLLDDNNVHNGKNIKV